LTAEPSAEVIAAFGADGSVVALDGGQGVAFRVGDVVMKAVDDPAEAAWIADLCSRIEVDGFRLPEQILARDGRWVRDGWTASRFIAGLRPLQPAWNGIVDVGLRFGDAASRVDLPTGALANRTHRWARADRVAWSEESVELPTEAGEVAEQISQLFLSSPSTERTVVHADLTGNVGVDPDGVPVVLDVSPYVRPRRWAAAIVVADAVMWINGPVSLARSLAGDAEDRDLLGRALMFRLVAEQLAEREGPQPRHLAALDPYRTVLGALA
jgi:uncharacterized protein (TIGR02569 family)